VLLPSALARLEDPRIKRLVVSDTVCQPEAIRHHPKITIVSVAKLLADVILRIHEGESISGLIEKA
jgi:ribose-phosphate pyrophosphokinase